MLKDPFQQDVEFCYRNFDVKNITSNVSNVELHQYPCILEKERGYQGGTYLPFIFTVFLLSPFILKMTLLTIVKSENYKKWKTKIKKIDNSIEEIGKFKDVTHLIPKHINKLFPFIPNELLSRLSFPYLRKAEKHFKELFDKKLKACRFSKEEQAIWLLFRAIKKANPQECIEILSRKLNQTVLGSKVAFFEAVVKEKKAEIENPNEELLTLLSFILGEEILNDTLKPFFDEATLKNVIKTILNQDFSLRKAVANLLEKEENSNSCYIDSDSDSLISVVVN